MAHELSWGVAGRATPHRGNGDRTAHGDPHLLLPRRRCGLGSAAVAMGNGGRADEDQGDAVKVGKTVYAKNRKEWRSWLAKNHKAAAEIWLIYYKKVSGKPRVPYNDAVDEALCYGWIDRILKPIDGQKHAQRNSPRNKTSKLTDMNRERVRRLIKAGRSACAIFSR